MKITKTLVFNSLFPLIGLIIMLFVFACNKPDASKRTINAPTVATFNKRVGAPVDSATANRWKRNLKKQLATGRIPNPVTTYFLPASQLHTYTQLPKAVGVCFYYGSDSLNNVHIIPIGVDKDGIVIKVATVSSSAGPLSWTTAKEWRTRYQTQYPSATWGHFWGNVAISRLLENDCRTVRLSLGLNDEGKQQILFSDAAVREPAYEGDVTSPCPNACPEDNF